MYVGRSTLHIPVYMYCKFNNIHWILVAIRRAVSFSFLRFQIIQLMIMDNCEILVFTKNYVHDELLYVISNNNSSLISK